MNKAAAPDKNSVQGSGSINVAAAHDARRLEIWRHCFLAFPLSIGGIQWTATTSPITEMPASMAQWWTLTLKSDRFQFDALLPMAFFTTALQNSHPNVDLGALGEGDMLLIVEHLLGDPLAQLEELLGAYQEIVQMRRATPADVQHNSLQFTVQSEQAEFFGFLNIKDPLAERITERVMPYSSVDEKSVSDELGIMIGPIALDNQVFSNVIVGQIIDCGVQPNDNIRGFVLRSDQRYWPGFVEDAQFLISGAHQALDFSAARRAGKTLVSLQFANAFVTAVDRLRLADGDRIYINRYENNDVRLFANDQEHAYGRLLVHKGNLAVQISYIKSAE